MQLDFLGIFGAGLLTFASPCILPLVPIYLGLLGGAAATREGGSRFRLLTSAIAFAAGLSLVFVGLGMAATAVGSALVAHRALLLQLGGLAVFLFGLKFLGVLHVPWLEREYRPLIARAKGGGVVTGFVLGAAFGLGWSPCIGPILGSVLTYTATAAANPMMGGLYLALYAAGLSLPLIAVAAIAPIALGWLKRLQPHMPKVQLATGAVLAMVGLLLITDNLGALQPSLSPPSTAAVPSEVVPQPTKQPMLALAPAAPSAAAQGQACDAAPQAGGSASCGLPSQVALTEAARAALPVGPALVEFVSSRCPICLRMAPVVAAAERDCAGQNVTVRKVQVDAPGGLELARRYGVIGVPTFLFVDAAGKEVARLVGEQPLATLEQSLQVLSGQQCASFKAFPTPG